MKEKIMKSQWIEKKFKIRRRMAVGAYIQISLLIPIILTIVFFGTSSVASNLAAASAVLITLIGALVGIIGHYNHMVYKQDLLQKEEDDVDKTN